MHWMKAVYVWLARAIIFAVSAIGAVLIVVLQWNEAARQTGLGTSNYGQGSVGTGFLTIIIGGIPALIWAVVSYLGLSWLLLRTPVSPVQTITRNAGDNRTTTIAHSQWLTEADADFHHLDLDEKKE